jgi:hypothetical protein
MSCRQQRDERSLLWRNLIIERIKPMQRLLNLYYIPLFLLSLLAACSSSPATPTVDPTQAVLSVAGDYRMVLTAEDLQRSGLTDPGLKDNLGNWQFILGADGNFTASRDGQFIADGNFGFKGNEMGIQVLHVCEVCTCLGNIGRYAWNLENQQLIVKKIYDPCDSMALVLTSKPLQRK